MGVADVDPSPPPPISWACDGWECAEDGVVMSGVTFRLAARDRSAYLQMVLELKSPQQQQIVRLLLLLLLEGEGK